MSNYTFHTRSALLSAAGLFVLMAAPVLAQTAAQQSGWYVKGEIGGQLLGSDHGYWWGPGGPPADPRVTFSLDDALGVSGSMGAGYDWGNGIRVDGTIGVLTHMQVDGAFDSASDGTTTGHATDIHAPVSAFAAFGNIYVEPLRFTGSNLGIQPFLTAGLGFANVSMEEWTRINPSAPQPTRSWNGASQANFAWQIGGGVSFALGEPGGGGYIDLTYRYADFGEVSGGSAPVNPPPSSSPTEAFNFPLTSHALTIGLRMPLR